MNRRSFIGSILALGAAPAIVRADSLMRLVVPNRELIVPGYPDGAIWTAWMSVSGKGEWYKVGTPEAARAFATLRPYQWTAPLSFSLTGVPALTVGRNKAVATDPPSGT